MKLMMRSIILYRDHSKPNISRAQRARAQKKPVHTRRLISPGFPRSEAYWILLDPRSNWWGVRTAYAFASLDIFFAVRTFQMIRFLRCSAHIKLSVAPTRRFAANLHICNNFHVILSVFTMIRIVMAIIITKTAV